jgi:tRNA G10  N-methylase Trm11
MDILRIVDPIMYDRICLLGEQKSNIEILRIVDPDRHDDIIRLGKQIALVYQRMDKNHDNHVTRNEFATFLTDVSTDNRKVRKDIANRIVRTNDEDNDHNMQEEEFRTHVLNKLNEKNLKSAIVSLTAMATAPKKDVGPPR